MGSSTATTVGQWAMSEEPLIHLLGDILHDDGINQVGHLVPAPIQPIRRIRDTIWSTGKDWTTAFFGAPESKNAEEMAEVKGLRMLLRYSKGLRTRWEQRGLRCEFKTIAKESMMKMRESRRSARGDFIAEAVGHRKFKDMDLADEGLMPTKTSRSYWAVRRGAA
ncbi:unnamed protein product [Phytophthora lilii]|uniref:Unnamed protein product n=1 Tax=Phytophthora lilii TaxID=2077276 RepID=A0A9W6TCW4_9STRA|nr:unnamed protein product [Phytophthora lilii]